MHGPVRGAALGPLVMGVLIDAGVSVAAICGIFALSCVAATGLQIFGLRGLGVRPA